MPSKPPTWWHTFWVHGVRRKHHVRMRNLRQALRTKPGDRPRGWWHLWLSTHWRNPINQIKAYQFPTIAGGVKFPPITEIAESIISVQPMTGAVDGLFPFAFEHHTLPAYTPPPIDPDALTTWSTISFHVRDRCTQLLTMTRTLRRRIRVWWWPHTK